ncbi:hypothetical protein [Pseudoalteromonas luteoviolacea]|uniref:hypothetical protein n=1 Tax=Pseudoalteromonas luteoviolacea TaxID=43657 RepID=UPI000A8FB66D|nr:hypothetical protein [Pseudoalteromonas luteoviolacea]
MTRFFMAASIINGERIVIIFSPTCHFAVKTLMYDKQFLSESARICGYKLFLFRVTPN